MIGRKQRDAGGQHDQRDRCRNRERQTDQNSRHHEVARKHQQHQRGLAEAARFLRDRLGEIGRSAAAQEQPIGIRDRAMQAQTQQLDETLVDREQTDGAQATKQRRGSGRSNEQQQQRVERRRKPHDRNNAFENTGDIAERALIVQVEADHLQHRDQHGNAHPFGECACHDQSHRGDKRWPTHRAKLPRPTRPASAQAAPSLEIACNPYRATGR